MDKMFSFNVEKFEDNICKNHSARSEREIYRVSPTKLSRQKLEDLYFSLLDNNLELKRTVNSQNEKIKVMSTKLLRLMETRKILSGKDQKECCAAATAVVIEQKNENDDLRHKNLRLSEKIRTLNMRLCSAKQFLKTSPQSVSKAGRCRTAPVRSVKISSSTNILNAKNNDSLNERILNETNSRNVSTRTVEMEISEKEILQLCDENRCKVVKEDLEQRIVLLQEKMNEMEMENANKVFQLKGEIEELQLARADAERCMRKLERDAETFATQYRNATTQCDELSMQLSIERKKVVELETELKLMQMSESRRILEPHESSYLQSPLKDFNDSRYSNDSGYTDEKNPRVTKDVIENKKQFLEKMAELQTELDTLKMSIDNELMSQDRQSLDLKIKDILNRDDFHKLQYSEESYETRNDEANVNLDSNTTVVDIVKGETDDIEKSTTGNKNNNKVNGDYRTGTELSKLNVIHDEECTNNVELENKNSINRNIVVNKSNEPLSNQRSNDKINCNTKHNSRMRVKNKKVTKSKSLDDKNNRSEMTGSDGAKCKRASVDLPLVFNVTSVKPQSVAMEVKFDNEFKVTEEKELEFDGDLDRKDEQSLSARTYTVSPDTTRQELSALSDLPSERDVCRVMSPGEVNEASQSLSASSSSVEFGSLSEGEFSGGTRLSLGEREIVNGETHTSGVHQESTSQRVASTMREVCEEMSRCKRLLAAVRHSNL